MQPKKNIILGKTKFFLFYFVLFYFLQTTSYSNESLFGKFVEIKILDKVNSKNSTLVLKIGEEQKFKNLPTALEEGRGVCFAKHDDRVHRINLDTSNICIFE